MSAEIVNLRQARKTKARTDKQAMSEQNRAKFGRTKAEKARDAKQGADAAQTLDGKKLKD